MAKKIVATALSEFEYSADFYDVSTELSARYGLCERNVDILARRGSMRFLAYAGVKRAFDIVASFFGCLVVLPVALVVKVAYLSNGDKASIFYKQKRIGKDGKIINIYKSKPFGFR